MQIRWQQSILMLAILLLAAGVRFHNLGAQSFWYDEGVAYGHSQRSLAALIPRLQDNVHVPAYFGSLALWEDVAGSTEFALRAYSVLWSLLSVAGTYALGRRLFSSWAGLAAALFVALNSFSIYYAQETRMYAMMSAIAVLSMWAFAAFVLRASPRANAQQHSIPGSAMWRWGAGFALLNVVGLYTHVSYALVMLVQGVLLVLWLLALLRRSGLAAALRAFLVYTLLNVGTLLVFAPWVLTAISQISAQPNISAPLPWGDMLILLQGWLAFGRTYAEGLAGGGMSVVVYFLLLFGLLIPRNLQQRTAWWRLLLPVVWVLLSVGVYLALGLYARYLRFLLPAQIGFALWMGRGAWVLWNIVPRSARYRPDALTRYVPKIAAVVAVLSLCVPLLRGLDALYNDPAHQRDDYRSLVQTITAEARDGDAIVLSAPGLQEIFGYYYDGALPVYTLPAGADIAGDTEAIIAQHEQLFVVLYGTAEQDPQGIVTRTLNTEAFPIRGEWVGDVRLERYAAPEAFAVRQDVEAQFGEHITLQAYALSATAPAAGDVLQVRLQWVTDAPLETRYKVFVQLLNSDGVLVAQRDSEPVGGEALTTLWEPGQPIQDHHALALPADLPAGEYTLIVGLYDSSAPSQRLPVGAGDYLPLGTLDVAAD